jgi:peptidoglycan/xylan/chitin deacetylase (PgdA/CDA1 family)
MRARKRIASLSLDLDNKWSYMKTHGDPGWESYPSYLDVAVPRVLRLLKERDLTITFFLVGQDAALEKNYAALSSIAADGHETGNHSFHHEPWLRLYTELQVEREIAQTEEHNAGAKDLIISAGGRKWWGYTADYLQARVENLPELCYAPVAGWVWHCTPLSAMTLCLALIASKATTYQFVEMYGTRRLLVCWPLLLALIVVLSDVTYRSLALDLAQISHLNNWKDWVMPSGIGMSGHWEGYLVAGMAWW